MDHFGRWLAFAVLAASAATFVLGTLWRGHPAADMFMMVVALAASAIPEGLPAIMTVTLALGVQRMAQRNAIIRAGGGNPGLGDGDLFRQDRHPHPQRNDRTAGGLRRSRIRRLRVGYEPLGDCRLDDRIVDPEHYPHWRWRSAPACSATTPTSSNRPISGASWAIPPRRAAGPGGKVGFSQHVADGAWPRLDSIPFESQHRFMASYHHDSDGAPWIFVKGAPERILEMCHSRRARRRPASRSRLLAAHGDRYRGQGAALALACKRSAPANDQLTFADVEAGYTLLALVGIIDPPREEAIVAVDECHRAGIRVKMITGDHAETARAIGAQLAIGVGKPAVTGAEVALMDDAALRRRHGRRRVRPRQPGAQAAPVQALQDDGRRGHDRRRGQRCPALKRADVGVAMGMKGTEAAKEASDMVLADDNFATIASAVREGRAVYDNLKKFILFMLPTNGGEALVVIAAILFELTLPLTPAQVLWINMVTSSTLGLALAFEPAERGIMGRRPRPPGEALLSGFFIWRVLMVSVLMMSGALGLFLWEMNSSGNVEAARTMAVNAVVMAEMFYLLNSRSILASVANRQA